MFIVVNYDRDYGLDEYGRYDTQRAAFASCAFKHAKSGWMLTIRKNRKGNKVV